MTETIIYIFLLALFEFYETSWQRGKNFKEILANLYHRYQKGIFFFLFSHPSFIYSLYLGIKYELTNIWFLSILFFKFLEISYKLVLIQKIKEKRVVEVLPIPLETPIAPWMSKLNMILYPTLLALAFLA